ncbi:hypothetical protein ECH_0283 [Ehrlichia chaffeensis str. Arkansas]|uniref:Uncharacterized protein n=1 Tax=Ehrlichia chaffeensis (strain ATCC CRL-10679 / Arkansas) TaxID=205920 RepID=Q2GHH9_EHRCR|nr:hypothetical protein ECH_0283 [Ehrlichia chaffeensis str. Arkansas]
MRHSNITQKISNTTIIILIINTFDVITYKPFYAIISIYTTFIKNAI